MRRLLLIVAFAAVIPVHGWHWTDAVETNSDAVIRALTVNSRYQITNASVDGCVLHIEKIYPRAGAGSDGLS